MSQSELMAALDGMMRLYAGKWSDEPNELKAARQALSRATTDRGGEVEPSEAEVEAALDGADYIPNADNRKWMRAGLKAAARIRTALATTAGEATPSEAELRAIASTVAEIRQGERSEPLCEPPSDYDRGIALEWTRRVFKAAALVTDKG